MLRSFLPRFLVALFFFVSGATGLVYEVIWSRYLENLFGVSTFAISTVVAAYMAGLALGSGLFGHVADRLGAAGCIGLYGLLELVIGLFAFAFTRLLEGAGGIYRSLAPTMLDDLGLRLSIDFALAFGLLMIPTTLMGGTLPLIARYFTTHAGRTGRGFGWAYALNTAGAVTGVLLAAFVLLEWLGLSVSLQLCGIVNLVLGGAAFSLARRLDPRLSAGLREEAAVAAAAGPSSVRPWMILLAAAGGFVSLGSEILWIRGFATLMLSTTQTFSLVLLVFLVGIAAGSWIGSRLPATRETVGNLLTLLGASALSQLVLYPFWWEWIYRVVVTGPTYRELLWTQFVIIGVTVLPLTLCSGALLPVIVGALARGLERAGRDVGRVYISNTVGSVLGVGVSGFLLLPLLGPTTGSRVLAGVAIGGAALSRLSRHPRGLLEMAGAALVLLAAVFWPGPGVFQQAVSPTVVGHRVASAAPDSGQAAARREFRRKAVEERLLVLDFQHGIAADTAVVVQLTKSRVLLWINGMPNASTGGDQLTQLSLAVLPYLYAKRLDHALHIGLGSGITVGSWAALPGTGHTSVVELEGQLWEQARLFEPFTLKLHERPNVQFVVDDARAYLELVRDHSLDIVSSEPSQLWVKGVGNLFALDFFELAKRKLREGGVFVTWMMANGIPGYVWGIGVATLLDSFEHVTAFVPPGSEGDVIFVCARRPLKVNRGRFEKLRALDGDRAAIRRRMGLHERSDLQRYLLADKATLRRETDRVLRAAGMSAIRNTVRHPVIEFLYPRYLVARGIENDLVEALKRARLHDRRLQPYVLLDLASGRTDSDVMERLTGRRSLRQAALDSRRLSAIQRALAFILAVRRGDRKTAERLRGVLRGRMREPALQGAALAYAAGNEKLMDELLGRMPPASPDTPLPVLMARLDRIAESFGSAAAQSRYVDTFVRAMPRSRFLETVIGPEYLAALVNAAAGCGRGVELGSYLAAIHQQHGGRLTSVTTALADLLSRSDDSGHRARARAVIAPYAQTTLGGYLGAVRDRLLR